MYIGEFRTGYEQRELPIMAVINDVPTAHMLVGQMVKVENGVVKTLVASTPAAALTEATHIIAQGDITMKGYDTDENGYHSVFGDYSEYHANAGKVRGTVATKDSVIGVYDEKSEFPAAASGNNGKFAYALKEHKLYKSTGTAWNEDKTGAATVKLVALYYIKDKSDIIVRENA